MIDRLSTLAELVVRASWQASVLAAIVALVVWCLGQRLAARWRYLLWSVVLVRLLLIAAPASSWSLYQFAEWPSPAEQLHPAEETVTLAETDAPGDLERPLIPEMNHPAAAAESREPVSSALVPLAVSRQPIEEPTDNNQRSAQPTTASVWFPSFSLRQVLAIAWLVGAAGLFGQLIWAYTVLQKKLARCQPVQDEAIQESLRAVRKKLGFKRQVELLVTAEPISPCVVGVWRPRLVVPELALTELDRASLEQVFSHELAHVVRGDLWTNWLMLAARSLHWFNPVAWWMVREMQSLREMACDEHTLAALDADQRQEYADTILSLVGLLAPSPLAPGMVALFSSRARLSRRIEHLARGSFGTRPARAVALTVLVILAMAGLTDRRRLEAEEPPAKPAVTGSSRADHPTEDPQVEMPAAQQPAAERASYVLRGQTMHWVAKADDPKQLEPVPVGQVDVALFRVRGMVGDPEMIAETKSDAEGRFSFNDLEWPRQDKHYDRLGYGLVLRAAGRPPAVLSYFRDDGNGPHGMRMSVGGNFADVSGQVVDERGVPIAGAVVYQQGIYDRPIQGVRSATTNQEGRFAIEDLSISPRFKESDGLHFYVQHPDYPKVGAKVHTIFPKDGKQAIGSASNAIFTIPAGCKLEGVVMDDATGKPAAGALVTAQNLENVQDDAATTTDSEGRYRLMVMEGNYNIFAESADRVCNAAISNQEATNGQTIELPPLELTAGGWIEGRVINTKTGEPVVDYRDAHPQDPGHTRSPSSPDNYVALGLYGPAYPPRKRVIFPMWLARVNEHGRFRMRAAAGENYPYLVNAHGQRMAWDTQKQPPVVVKTGETTNYDMLITPKPTDSEKMTAANEIMAALPNEMPARVDAIIAEFRKLNHTVDETEIWCSLMRELVAIGPAAVPALCAELDATDEQRTLRRLAFALRAIGDPRAVPALIRAIPKTLQPPLSDYGLLVGDAELMKFMQQHDLASMSGQRRLRHFDLGRPVREMFSALEKLTKQNLGEEQLYSVVKTEDPRAESAQQKMYRQQAEKWQAWWEQNWRDFTRDETYSRVGLPQEDQPSPQPFAVLGDKARTGSGKGGYVLSPLTESGTHFLDLDTGLEPKAPDAKHDLTLWAAQNGVDLMCVVYQLDDQPVYALRAFNMRLQEISLRDAKNIDKFLARSELPAGKPVGEFLLRSDDKTGQLATGNAAFLYQTREGGLGMIELTDQITEARDLTGQPTMATTNGVGFHKGAKFNYQPIVAGR